jgi:hypothetical protein
LCRAYDYTTVYFIVVVGITRAILFTLLSPPCSDEPVGGPSARETYGSGYWALGPSNANLTLLNILTYLHFGDNLFLGSKLIFMLSDTRARPH